MLIGFQITGMIQAKLVLAKGVRSQQDQELMQFGTLKIMLAQQIHAEEGLDQVCLTYFCVLYCRYLLSFRSKIMRHANHLANNNQQIIIANNKHGQKDFLFPQFNYIYRRFSCRCRVDLS